MADFNKPDWNPTSDLTARDPHAVYDDMRRRCPVAYSEELGWSLFRHADVVRVLEDHDTFSNRVSRHRSVPNGLDPPEHTAYRAAIEPFFTYERMQRFEPACRAIAAALLEPLAGRATFECMEDVAVPFALRCQCAFLGWPLELAEPIRDWTRRNKEATRAGHRATLVDVAREFREHVHALLQDRRKPGATAQDDVIGGLLATRIDGAPLSDDDIASILRNWTVGELGSLAAGVGIVAAQLADDDDLQQQLRAEPEGVPAAIEEILRTCGPLVMNRRTATRDVELGSRRIAAGERISILWVAANRDGAVFDEPAHVRLDRPQDGNLLYGAGIHACPGAPLARLELRVAIEELLRHTRHVTRDERRPARQAPFPASGWATLPLRLT